MNEATVRYDRVFVIATTVDETRHAVQVGQALAVGTHANLSVVVPLPEHRTVSSARAGVHDLPIDDFVHPEPDLSETVVRAIAERMGLHPEITVVTGWSADRLMAVLPAGATVVICGSMNHFIETPEQRIARELSRRKFDVVFLPSVPPAKDCDRRFLETEITRRLIC